MDTLKHEVVDEVDKSVRAEMTSLVIWATEMCTGPNYFFSLSSAKVFTIFWVTKRSLHHLIEGPPRFECMVLQCWFSVTGTVVAIDPTQWLSRAK